MARPAAQEKASAIIIPRRDHKSRARKNAGRKQQQAAGVFPTTTPYYLPDIEKADEGEEPNHKQFSPDVPMRQPPKSERNQARKKNSMFVMLREKVGESKSAGSHFLKKRGRSIPLIQKWDIHAIPEYEKAN